MTPKNLKSIKAFLQEYWGSIPSLERRAILSHVVTYQKLPYNHPVFKEDDIPYRCIKAWLEETIAIKDWNFSYDSEPCGC